MLTAILNSWMAMIGLLIVAASVATFTGCLLWKLSGRIEKVHWNKVEIKFRRQ